jgi:hypothetical protein
MLVDSVKFSTSNKTDLPFSKKKKEKCASQRCGKMWRPPIVAYDGAMTGWKRNDVWRIWAEKLWLFSLSDVIFFLI